MGASTSPNWARFLVSGMSFDEAKSLIRAKSGATAHRQSRERHHGRPALHTGIRARRGRKAWFLYGERAFHHDEMRCSSAVASRKSGSLRNIQLKRDGRLVSVLDLYDLLLHGDTSHDKHLQPGDVIFIPPIGKTVSVYGAVRRPAIYELKNETTVGQAADIAGGLLPDADGQDCRAAADSAVPSAGNHRCGSDLRPGAFSTTGKRRQTAPACDPPQRSNIRSNSLDTCFVQESSSFTMVCACPTS